MSNLNRRTFLVASTCTLLIPKIKIPKSKPKPILVINGGIKHPKRAFRLIKANYATLRKCRFSVKYNDRLIRLPVVCIKMYEDKITWSDLKLDCPIIGKIDFIRIFDDRNRIVAEANFLGGAFYVQSSDKACISYSLTFDPRLRNFDQLPKNIKVA